jgi:7-carboxy-7-deazaguanine synthase (Cx14CxxC type)
MYTVKEVFYTLQGEGARAGRAAVFLRFAGCNLWTGHAHTRARGPGGCSRWCDTDFVGADGPGGGRFADPESLSLAVASRWPQGAQGARPYVVCTGGEPLLQLDRALVQALHRQGFEVAVETNGTLAVPEGVDWVCVSPKEGGSLAVSQGDELKLVVPQETLDPAGFEGLGFAHWFLQPRDDPEREAHTAWAVRYCLSHPRWRLSVQVHKLVGIP